MRTLVGCTLAAWVVLAAGCSGSSATATPTSAPAAETPTAPGAATPTSAPVGPSPTTETVGSPTPGPLSTTTPTAAMVATPAEPDSGRIQVGFSSSTSRVRRGQEFRVDLTIDPRGRGISGVQLTVQYDPALFQALGVEPSKLLDDKPEQVRSDLPVIGIDNELGLVQYVDVRIGPTVGPTPAGTVATLRFRVPDGAAVGGRSTLKLTEVKVPDVESQGFFDVDIGPDLALEISS